MGTERFANGQVRYQAPDGSNKRCIDSLKDDVRYRFDCRCGCKSGFSGFGKDIKASGKIGQSTFPAIKDIHVRTISAPTVMTIDDRCSNVVLSSIAATDGTTQIRQSDTCSDVAERPFVSDRYLKKAVFGISDDEIDEDSKTRDDELAARGVNLAERQPPGIGGLVYSMATNCGPYSLLDYGNMVVKLSDGERISVVCGVVRTAKGKHIKIPLADLADHWGDRPVKEPQHRWLPLRVVMSIVTSVIGSAVMIAAYRLLSG